MPKKDLRRATIIVVASVTITLLLAFLTQNNKSNMNRKSSFLSNIENQKQKYIKKDVIKEEKRVDIKVLNLDGFSSIKSSE